MRTVTRLTVAGLVSVLAFGIVPAQGASAAPTRPANVYCCK